MTTNNSMIININNYIAYTSPILYMIYVEIAKRILPLENEKNRRIISCIRLMHNLGLSLLSFILCIGIIYSAYESHKFNSIFNALCSRFNDEFLAGWIGWYFYLSKYWEWLDTAFLIIAKKDISWLQYTHHMSTAILVYVNIFPLVSSASLVACFTNTFVHIFMYLYFAYPKSFLYKYRQWITNIQIIQHITCLSSFIYIYLHLDQCYTTHSGIYLALLLYFMYLSFFTAFYIVQYIIRKDDKDKKTMKMA